MSDARRHSDMATTVSSSSSSSSDIKQLDKIAAHSLPTALHDQNSLLNQLEDDVDLNVGSSESDSGSDSDSGSRSASPDLGSNSTMAPTEQMLRSQARRISIISGDQECMHFSLPPSQATSRTHSPSNSQREEMIELQQIDAGIELAHSSDSDEDIPDVRIHSARPSIIGPAGTVLVAPGVAHRASQMLLFTPRAQLKSDADAADNEDSVTSQPSSHTSPNVARDERRKSQLLSVSSASTTPGLPLTPSPSVSPRPIPLSPQPASSLSTSPSPGASAAPSIPPSVEHSRSSSVVAPCNLSASLIGFEIVLADGTSTSSSQLSAVHLHPTGAKSKPKFTLYKLLVTSTPVMSLLSNRGSSSSETLHPPHHHHHSKESSAKSISKIQQLLGSDAAAQAEAAQAVAALSHVPRHTPSNSVCSPPLTSARAPNLSISEEISISSMASSVSPLSAASSAASPSPMPPLAPSSSSSVASSSTSASSSSTATTSRASATAPPPTSTSWFIYKRYSDFYTLHHRLLSVPELGGSKVVEKQWHLTLPPKVRSPACFSSGVIETRYSLFDSYIKKLVLKEELRQRPEVLKFLGSMDETAEEKKKSSKYMEKGYKPKQLISSKLLAKINVASGFHIQQATVNAAAAQSSSTLTPLFSIPSSSIFDFLSTGDLLLFRTSSTLSKMQRSLTSSSWDHIGMVIQRPILSTNKSNLCLLESVNRGGIKCNPLEGMVMEWRRKGMAKLEKRRKKLAESVHAFESTGGLQDMSHDSMSHAASSPFPTISIRKLYNWRPTQEKLLELEAFLDSIIGNSYSIKGIFKLGKKKIQQMIGTSSSSSSTSEASAKPYLVTHANGSGGGMPPHHAATHSRDDSERAASPSSIPVPASAHAYAKQSGYFCSELIAACYRVAGLLPPSLTDPNVDAMTLRQFAHNPIYASNPFLRKSISEFLPGDFSTENMGVRMNLDQVLWEKGGVKLGEEIRIDLESEVALDNRISQMNVVSMLNDPSNPNTAFLAAASKVKAAASVVSPRGAGTQTHHQKRRKNSLDSGSHNKDGEMELSGKGEGDSENSLSAGGLSSASGRRWSGSDLLLSPASMARALAAQEKENSKSHTHRRSDSLDQLDHRRFLSNVSDLSIEGLESPGVAMSVPVTSTATAGAAMAKRFQFKDPVISPPFCASPTSPSAVAVQFQQQQPRDEADIESSPDSNVTSPASQSNSLSRSSKHSDTSPNIPHRSTGLSGDPLLYSPKSSTNNEPRRTSMPQFTTPSSTNPFNIGGGLQHRLSAPSVGSPSSQPRSMSGSNNIQTRPAAASVSFSSSAEIEKQQRPKSLSKIERLMGAAVPQPSPSHQEKPAAAATSFSFAEKSASASVSLASTPTAAMAVPTTAGTTGSTTTQASGKHGPSPSTAYRKSQNKLKAMLGASPPPNLGRLKPDAAAAALFANNSTPATAAGPPPALHVPSYSASTTPAASPSSSLTSTPTNAVLAHHQNRESKEKRMSKGRLDKIRAMMGEEGVRAVRGDSVDLASSTVAPIGKTVTTSVPIVPAKSSISDQASSASIAAAKPAPSPTATSKASTTTAATTSSVTQSPLVVPLTASSSAESQEGRLLTDQIQIVEDFLS